MKITFSKSEPYKSGWRGWTDFVDVFVDGEKIGVLFADGDDHRKYMSYHFTNKLKGPNFTESPRSSYEIDLGIGVMGLRAAKAALIKKINGATP